MTRAGVGAKMLVGKIMIKNIELCLFLIRSFKIVVHTTGEFEN